MLIRSYLFGATLAGLMVYFKLFTQIDAVIGAAIMCLCAFLLQWGAPASNRGLDGRMSRVVAGIRFGVHFFVLASLVLGLCFASGAMEWVFILGLAALHTRFSALTLGETLFQKDGAMNNSMAEAVFSTLGIGHYRSVYFFLHADHRGRIRDPLTPARGEGLYHFMRRAIVYSFRQGHKAETQRRQHFNMTGQSILHPYAKDVLTLGALCAISLLAFGPAGVLGYLCIVAVANLTVFTGAYLKFYGLRTHQLNAQDPQLVQWVGDWFTSASNAKPDGPRYPLPVALMALASLLPVLWRYLVDRRLHEWSAGH